MVPIPGRVEWERHAGRLPLDPGQVTVLVAGAGGPEPNSVSITDLAAAVARSGVS